MRVKCSIAALELSGAHEQVADRVDGAPVAGLFLDDLQVFGDRLVEPALAEELLGFPKRRVAIDGHPCLTGLGADSGDRLCPVIGRSGRLPQVPGRFQAVEEGSRSERPAVDRRVAEPGDGAQVFGGARSPCGDRTRSGDRPACRSAISRSRTTLATMEAAAMAEQRASPCTMPRWAIGRSGMRKASTRTRSGRGTSASTAWRIAWSEARWMLMRSISAGSTAATDHPRACRVIAWHSRSRSAGRAGLWSRAGRRCGGRGRARPPRP